MTDGKKNSGVLSRKLKSALCAASLALFILAVFPLSQVLFSPQKEKPREYLGVNLAKRQNPQNNLSGVAKNLNIPLAPPPSAMRADTPNLSMPSNYGKISYAMADGGNIFSANSFSAGNSPDIEGGDFEMKFFDLSQLDKIPRRLNSVSPQYPRSLLSRGVEGEVVLSVFINADGRLEVDSVVSSTDKGFEDYAIKAASKLLYESPTRGGQAVRARFILPVPFKILK